jgi:S-adenosylmethionine/arginine decarboxylase-like enzyme
MYNVDITDDFYVDVAITCGKLAPDKAAEELIRILKIKSVEKIMLA